MQHYIVGFVCLWAVSINAQYNDIDAAFVLDFSDDQGLTDFGNSIGLVEGVISSWTIGDANASRVAVASYGSTFKSMYAFSNPQNIVAIGTEINKPIFFQTSAGTDTGTAISDTATTVFASGQDNRNIILVTNGGATADQLTAADTAATAFKAAMNSYIYVVADNIASDSEETALQGIASEPMDKFYLEVNENVTFADVQQTLIDRFNAPPETTSMTPPTTSVTTSKPTSKPVENKSASRPASVWCLFIQLVTVLMVTLHMKR